jgi:hypothetical protein
MNNINMANMNAMTGHVHDASLTMMNSCAVAPHGALRQLQENYNKQTQLNTYIYEYFLRYGMFDCAQAILKADSDVNVQRHSPRSPRDDKRCRLRNTLSDESIDIGTLVWTPNSRGFFLILMFLTCRWRAAFSMNGSASSGTCSMLKKMSVEGVK